MKYKGNSERTCKSITSLRQFAHPSIQVYGSCGLFSKNYFIFAFSNFITLTPLNWGTSSCDLTNGY
jgi:hypothetical protein